MTPDKITPLSPSAKRTLVQYEKLFFRLRQSLKNGRFCQYSKTRQQQFISTIKRYHKRLVQLAVKQRVLEIPSNQLIINQLSFKKAIVYLNFYSLGKNTIPIRKLAAGAALILALMDTHPILAQTYVQPTGSANSLGFVDVGNNSFPAFLDIDNDGDQDAFVGNGIGQIAFFRNDGTSTSPNFTEIIGAGNPLNGVDVGSNAAPVFADIDNDGDLDAFIGNSGGKILFFRNDGAVFTPIIGAGNPFNGVDIGTMAAPNFIDIDNDGDLDAFIAGNAGVLGGKINFFRNDGNNVSPSFTPIIGIDNPFDSANLGIDPNATFVDFDKDGDFDVFVGSQLGMIQYYQNNGNNTVPVFNLISGNANPFNGLDVGRNGALIPNPCFVDINGDGNMDIFIGNLDGTVNFFQNDPNIVCNSSSFFEVNAADNPSNGQDVGEQAYPDFVDIDQDGDFDLFVGDDLGRINFFRNDGNAGSPNFTAVIGANNPFDGVDIGDDATIDFIDIDNDGDKDAFLGEDDGFINFFRNDGTATNPIFTEIVGAANPFNGVDVGDQSSPVFADIDNDGDLDAFIGNKDGRILFFRNDGTSSNPSFVQFTDTTNPFFGVDLEGNFTPEFADIDRDGDLDAIIGNKAGTLYFFRNDGTASVPNFVGLYGECNPFQSVLPATTTDEEFSAPVFVDIDKDGVLDLFIGQFGGQISFIEQNPPQSLVAKDEIPTLSQWGIITLSLLLLSFGTILIARKEELLIFENSENNSPSLDLNQDWSIILRKPPINWQLYFKALFITGLLALLLAFSTLSLYGTIAFIDVIGTLTAAPIFAYLLHLMTPPFDSE